jgi:hypothetical protein
MTPVGAFSCNCLDRLGALVLKGFRKQLEWRSELMRRVNVCAQEALKWLTRPALTGGSDTPAHREEARSPSPVPQDPGGADSVPTRPHSLAPRSLKFGPTRSPSQRAFDALFASFMRALSPALSPPRSSDHLPYGREVD